MMLLLIYIVSHSICF